jgi:hypothetical protein
VSAFDTGDPERTGATRRYADSESDPPEDRLPAAVPGLRPYLITSGRVRPRDQTLAIETQVVTTSEGMEALSGLSFEPRDILELCVEPLSIAEVAARLGLHLGVVRILVDDLAGHGYVALVPPVDGGTVDVELIRRVIRGLQAIT